MPSIIEQYYRGITQQLRSEVNFINSLFEHQGVKGSGNEEILRDLLTKFIPKRYGVGTGIVVDKHGHQSRQSDIIIYDTFLYPSLLSLATLHLFPVDIVYATIEVKTTLDSSSSKEALENIASVKRLDFVKEIFRDPVAISAPLGGLGYTEHEPFPPLGFIFAYNSDAARFETFEGWFTANAENEILNFPTLIGCLDQGLIVLEDGESLGVKPKSYMRPKGWMIPLRIIKADGQSNLMHWNRPRKNYVHENMDYPVKQFGKEYFAIDPGRTLLLFLIYLNEMLGAKKINPDFSFMQHYIPEELEFHYKTD